MSLTDTTARSLGVDVTVADVVHETNDAVSLVFDVDISDDTRFHYHPGQFLTLRVPSERDGSVARCYSLASAPSIDRLLKVTVKRTAEGYASNWLCDNATPGMTIRVLPPSGTFVARTFDHDLLLFAGGSGITPVMSILKTALRTSQRTVSLFYANRDRSSVIFDSELSDLAREFEGRLTVRHWLEDEEGIPTAGALHDYADSHPEAESFICGPGPFMLAVERVLESLGKPKKLMHVERFVSLSGDPFTLKIDNSVATEHSTVNVELDGEQHTLEWPSTSTLIDVLVAAGIDAPYSCREGECGSCACVLKNGTVDPGKIAALTAEDVDDGYILACQAKPISAELDVEF